MPEHSNCLTNSLISLANTNSNNNNNNNNSNNSNKPQDFTVVASSPITHDSQNTPLSY